MQYYPAFLEVILYGSFLYLFYRKKELVILYLPMLFFIRNLMDDFILRQLIWYFLVTFSLVFASLRVNVLSRINLPALFLLVYFTILYIYSHSMSSTRSSYFAMVCLIFVFFLAPNLYAKYGREVILNNLAKMATGILLLFIGNSILSTVTGYSPYQLYGRSTGILYGSMGPTEFMAVPIALFIYLLYHMERINLVQLGIALLGFGLALISFRRSVQMAAVTALVVFMALLFLSGDRKRVFTVSVSFVVITLIALVFTDFTDQFQERYEGRFGDQDLVHVEEGRFTDHIMVYEDIFVHNRYSLMFGYGFFNSSGNYAGGIRGDRSLHPDVAVLVHASGLLGLVLYLGMVLRAFRQSCRASGSYVDKGIWLFCLVAFIIFTFSGRIQETAYSMSVFLLLYVPLAGKSSRRYSQEEERTGGDGAEEIEDRKKILVEEI